MIESVLFLSASMPIGLGLLLPNRPHRKTPAQLLRLAVSSFDGLWQRAAEHGRVSMLQWLQNNTPIMDYDARIELVKTAVQYGHVEVLKWLSKRRSGYVCIVISAINGCTVFTKKCTILTCTQVLAWLLIMLQCIFL